MGCGSKVAIRDVADGALVRRDHSADLLGNATEGVTDNLKTKCSKHTPVKKLSVIIVNQSASGHKNTLPYEFILSRGPVPRRQQ